jgi:hypothetical protein
MTKIRNLNVLNIDYWNLEFICYLGIVIWCFFISKSQPQKISYSAMFRCLRDKRLAFAGEQPFYIRRNLFVEFIALHIEVF